MAATAHPIIYQLLNFVQLTPRKSKPSPSKTRNPDINRQPIIRTKGMSVHHVQHLKLLGLTIDTYLNWIPNINQLVHELISFHQNSPKITCQT